MLSISPATVQLVQLADMKFEDRREKVKKHPFGKERPVEHRRHPRSGIDAIVLHAMGFNRTRNRASKYDGINAHFAVLRTGEVLYLHDIEEYLNAAHDFNRRSISIEFAGNPPDEDGRVYKPRKFGLHIPTVEQILNGRKLVRALALSPTLNVRYIYGHKQSCDRKICPGPHIWYNVGRWAQLTLGLSDGGAGYKTANEYAIGRAIPVEWNDPQFAVF